MTLFFVVVTLGVSPTPMPIGSPLLTCGFYNLAHEFAHHTQPQLAPSLSKAVYDALQLSACNISFVPRAATPKRRLHARGQRLVVDPLVGRDDDEDTSTPFATIEAAVLRARSLQKPSTIALRGGVHRLQATLTLNALDSGLTIEPVPGENAEITGAASLGKLAWRPYNVTPGTPTMSALNSTNLVAKCAEFKSTAGRCPYHGVTGDASACSAACAAQPSCGAFTWHSASQPSGAEAWAKQCYFVTAGMALSLQEEAAHESGIKTTSWRNIYVADVAAPGMTGLRVDGLRAIRARWPNGDPEVQLFPSGWTSPAKGDWQPPVPHAPASTVKVDSPNRSDEGPCESSSGYCNYVVGVGGGCTELGYQPAAGYWCATKPPRGAQYSANFPAALRYGAQAFDGRTWPSFAPNRSVLNAFRSGHWFSYAFLIDHYDPTARKLGWTVGGFQGGEGDQSAEEWNVENVFEELDAPNEWFYDEDHQQLYYFHNGTGPPPDTMEFAATGALQELIVIRGGGTARGETAAPVRDLTIQGVTLRGAALSYFAPHGMPSDGGGDWAVARIGAIRIEGAERVTITDCVFDRLDGNAVVIQGYTRNVTIRDSEFHRIGENGIISWGFTADLPNASRPVSLPPRTGPDATDGNHPQGNLVAGNVFHEIGHFQKQVSCYFQAQTQRSTLSSNICFNGPRAGINFNDGMGGGNLLEGNLVFNMVRETQDHGTFNSWDRQPFLIERDGKPTFVPLVNEIRGNLMINNFNPQEAIDNDDGSAYYNTHHNVFPFSTGGLKNDFGGHDNHHHHNLYYNAGGCMGVCPQKPGHEDAFYNNTCMMTSDREYAHFALDDISGPALPIMHDNRVFTPGGTATENGKSITEWQAQGHDLGTTVAKLPSDAEVIRIAREILGL